MFLNSLKGKVLVNIMEKEMGGYNFSCEKLKK
jgi:hypothetical protein